MMNPLAAFALVVVLAVPALAFNEPDGFRGLKWGASKEELDKAEAERGNSLGPHCLAMSDSHQQTCIAGGTIGDARVSIHYRFRDNKLVRVMFGFATSDFTVILGAFTERYGAPTKRREEPYQTRGGIRTTNQVLTWRGKSVEIEIMLYGESIDKGLADLVTRQEMDRDLIDRAKAIKKGKDDL
jgi:hypothetical protein